MAIGYSIRLDLHGMVSENAQRLHASVRNLWLEDAASLVRAVAGCRYLFHVAADYRLWVPDPMPMYHANVEGTRVLMRAALDAGVERVVYTSSVATLGLVAEGSADEDTPSRLEDMIGPYKRSKFQAEEIVRDLVEGRGLRAVIVNPSTPVGPRDRKPTSGPARRATKNGGATTPSLLRFQGAELGA